MADLEGMLPADVAREGPMRAVVPPGEGVAGTSPGINIAPGSDDDGWVVPPPVKLSDGSVVQLYKDGEALQAAYKAIEHARFLVCLEVYIFADDSTGKAFADLLCKRAREGLKVFVIYDSFGSNATDRKMFRDMRNAGCRVIEYHPIRPWEVKFSWRPLNRDHRKLLLIDDNIAGMGGLNIGREYAGSWIVPNDADECDPWRDNAIGIIGPAARQFMGSFARTWRYVTHGGPSRRAEWIYGLGLNGSGRRGETPADLGVLASVPTLNSPLRPLLHRLFEDARESVDLTMAYFAPDDDLLAALGKAAKRGCRIRLMLPSRSDAQILITAAHSYYERMMDMGIEVYERNAAILHAKTMVIDKKVSVIGSTNLDYRSIEFNCELSSVIRSDAFGQQMNGLFENDICYATRIPPGEWRKRPWRDRFGQWVVSRARYLL